VVIFSPLGFSSMLARVCKICSLRSPGFVGMAAFVVGVGKGYPNGVEFNTNRRGATPALSEQVEQTG